MCHLLVPAPQLADALLGCSNHAEQWRVLWQHMLSRADTSFTWYSVGCDDCGIFPIRGRRYRCAVQYAVHMGNTIYVQGMWAVQCTVCVCSSRQYSVQHVVTAGQVYVWRGQGVRHCVWRGQGVRHCVWRGLGGAGGATLCAEATALCCESMVIDSVFIVNGNPPGNPQCITWCISVFIVYECMMCVHSVFIVNDNPLILCRVSVYLDRAAGSSFVGCEVILTVLQAHPL